MMARVSTAATLVALAWLMRLLAREREGRLFLTPLGRPLEAADRGRARRVRVGSLLATLAGLAAVLRAESDGVLRGVVLAATLLPPVHMLIELRAALASRGTGPTPARFVVPLGPGAPRLRGLLSWPLQLAHAALLAAGAAGLWLQTPPPAARAAVDPGTLGALATSGRPWALAALNTALLLGFAWATAHERWVLPPAGGARYAALALERRRLGVRLLELILLAVDASLMVEVLASALGDGAAQGPRWGGIAAPCATLGAVGALAWCVPRLVAVEDELRALGGGAVLGTHPAGWRWGGLVYFAPEDPALLVSKRSGVGQTLNFARPAAWALLAAFVALPLAVVAARDLLGAS